MSPTDAILLIAVLLNTIFAGLIFFHSRRESFEVFFALVALGVALWAGAILLSTSDFFSAFIFQTGFRLHFIFGNIIWFSFFFFAWRVIHPKVTRKDIITLLIGIYDCALLLEVFYGNYIISDRLNGFSSISDNISDVFSYPGTLIYVLTNITLFLTAEFFLVRHFHNLSLVDKPKIKYLILGTFVAGGLGIISNLILLIFGNFSFYSIGPVFSTIFIGAIGYAILKHGLFSLRIIAAELFTILLILAATANIFTAPNAVSMFVQSVVLIIAIILSYFLIRSVYQEVRSREEIERLAHDLELANVELKRLDQAKSEFISIASHQLRTPLTIIKGYISMIREGSYGKVSPEIGTTMNKVYLSNERLIKLVNDLLDLSRMESGRMKYEFAEMDLKALVDSIVDEFQLPAKDKGINIARSQSQAGGLPKIFGDAWKLRQVIFNLVDNSLKYTNAGGIEIKLEKEDDSLKLSVKDSGIGMSQETAGAVFHKFVRGGKEASKINAGGTGLGLYIAKRIVDDHKGEIWAESDGEGKGSTFFIKIPISAK